MANNDMMPSQVRSICNELEVSPSKDETSSPVYGNRKTAGGAHSSTSGAGGMKESGFKMPKK